MAAPIALTLAADRLIAAEAVLRNARDAEWDAANVEHFEAEQGFYEALAAAGIDRPRFRTLANIL